MGVLPLITFLIGLCVGSFLDVLADRLPRGEDVLWGRSHCDYCKKNLRWFELIPVVSYVLQGGRCGRCHKTLSIQYPLSELVTGLGFLFLYPSIPLMIVFSVLVVIFLSDFHTQIIPDSMVALGSIGAILYHISYATIVSAIVSFAFLYILWTVTRGRGMGFGDVKYAFFMGLFLGFPNIVVGLYVAFLTGAVTGVILILTGKKRWKSAIAFGPFLVVGTVVAFLWGQNILAALHLLNFSL